jgi:hypothetical protein
MIGLGTDVIAGLTLADCPVWQCSPSLIDTVTSLSPEAAGRPAPQPRYSHSLVVSLHLVFFSKETL